MANFLINSAAVSVTGTEEKDTFQLTTGASAVSIQGLAADDTVVFSGISAGFKNGVIQANDGDDTINTLATTAGVSLSNVSIGGSFGKDTLTFGDFANVAGLGTVTVNGGVANDTINFRADLSGTASALSINGGQDDDTIFVTTAGGTTIKTSIIGGGKGEDEIRSIGSAGANFIATTINGGLGEDDIILFADDISATTINGGSNGVVDSDTDSADRIFIDVAGGLNKSTILGNGGDDLINVSADQGTGFSIGGGEGKDSIVYSGGASGATIGGGKGDDTIRIESAGSVLASSIIGGNGKDSITIFGIISADTTGLTVQGGAQADTINLQGISDTSAGEANFEYVAFTDSTLTELDKVSVNANTAGEIINSFVSVGVGVASDDTDLGGETGVDIADGFIAGFGDSAANPGIGSAGGLTATVEFLDGELSNNQAVAFALTAGSTTQYLFVQGGETDLLVEFNDMGGFDATLTAQSVVGATKLIQELV